MLLQANLTGPRPLAGIRNEVAFNIVAAYRPLAIIYTNPLVGTVPFSHFSTRRAAGPWLIGVMLLFLVDGGASETLIFHPELWRNLTIPVVEIGFRASAEIVELVERNNSLIVAVDIGGTFSIANNSCSHPRHAQCDSTTFSVPMNIRLQYLEINTTRSGPGRLPGHFRTLGCHVLRLLRRQIDRIHSS